MTRFRAYRTIAAALLALALLVPSVAIAGQTRIIYIGDPLQAPANANQIPAVGPLSNTQTPPGGLTAVDVLVKNYGGQTINHASLEGGDDADARPDNANFPPPNFASLPANYTFAAAFPTTACTISDAGRSVACDIGTLVGGGSFVARFVIQTPTGAAAAPSYWFGVFLAEGNATGTNQDNFFAAGSLTTTNNTCGAAANYFLPGTSVQLNNVSPCGQTQSANLNSLDELAADGQGGFAIVGNDATFTGAVPKGYVKVGTTINASVLGGNDVPGGLQWTVTWYGITKLTAIFHYLDGGGVDLIPLKNNGCSASNPTNCIVLVRTTKPNAVPSWIEVTFVTLGNGRVGGAL